MDTKARTSFGTVTQSPYEHMQDEDLGQGLTEAELYFWATEKRRDGLAHKALGHQICTSCKNCTCGEGRMRCICASGKKYVTPRIVGFLNDREKEIAYSELVYCVNHHIYEHRGAPC